MTTRISSVVSVRENSTLIVEVARLWFRQEDRILDMTYGGGKWWTEFRPLGLKGYRRNFLKLPFEPETFNIVLFDPPYVSIGGRETSTLKEMHARYGNMRTPPTPAGTRALIRKGMTEGARVLAPKGLLMVKCSDYISSGRYQQGHRDVVNHADALGLKQVDEFIHNSGLGAQPKKNPDGSTRRQVHSHRSHSFLCVFKKK